MHFRRLACLILGAWLGGSALAVLVIIENRSAPGRLLSRPNAAALVVMKSVGRDGMTAFARYQAAEASRSYIESWENIELLLGTLLLLVLLFGTHEGKLSLLVAALMLAAALAQRFFFTPEVAWYGRLLDFTEDVAGSPAYLRLSMFKGVWTGMEAATAALGLLLAARLLRHRTGLDSPREVDAVDKRYHRHINR